MEAEEETEEEPASGSQEPASDRGRVLSGDPPTASARVRSRSPPRAVEGGSTSSGTVAPYGLNPVPLPRPDDAESTGSESKRPRHLLVMLASGCEDFAMAPSDETFLVPDQDLSLKHT